MIQGIIFDLDGVLVDTGDFHELAWKRFAENHKIDLSDSFFIKIFGDSIFFVRKSEKNVDFQSNLYF